MPIKWKKGVAVPANRGVPAPRRSIEEKIDISKKICDAYATGKYTVRALCKAYGVSFKAFQDWSCASLDVADIIARGDILPERCVPEIHFMLKDARKIADMGYAEQVKDAARQSLLKKIKGYTTEEVVEEYDVDCALKLADGSPNPNYGKPVLVGKKVRTKHIAPSDALIMFGLENTDSANFKAKPGVSVSTSVNTADVLSDKSDEEIKAMRMELEAKINATTTKKIYREADIEDIEAEIE